MSTPKVQNKPTAAFVLSLVGGILALIAAFVLIAFAAIFATVEPYSYTSGYYYYSTDIDALRVTAWILGGVGAWVMAAAIVVLISAVKLNSNPLEHSKYGLIILLFSIFGGINIFGIIGGALALSYKPQTSEVPSPYATQGYARYCPYCGSALDSDSKFCPSCGKQVS
jgi:hypothetical protein